MSVPTIHFERKVRGNTSFKSDQQPFSNNYKEKTHD